MTNEEMAVCVQNGNVSLIPELWERVERYISRRAFMRAAATDDRGGATKEDLYQSGFFALLDAVRDFEPERGFKFVTYLNFPLLKAFNETAGYRTKRQLYDPIHSAESLDVPIGDNEDSMLADFVEDKNSLAPFEEVENKDAWKKLEAALQILPDEQREVITLRYYHDLSLDETAWYLGVEKDMVKRNEAKALRTLRSPKIRNAYGIYSIGRNC